jgi:hypothetical protein
LSPTEFDSLLSLDENLAKWGNEAVASIDNPQECLRSAALRYTDGSAQRTAAPPPTWHHRPPDSNSKWIKKGAASPANYRIAEACCTRHKWIFVGHFGKMPLLSSRWVIAFKATQGPKWVAEAGSLSTQPNLKEPSLVCVGD